MANIVEFLKEHAETASRITIVRDLAKLTDLKFLVCRGAGPSVRYSVSSVYNVIKKIDIQQYFSLDQDERNAKKTFNFPIFNLLQNEIFTELEVKYLDSLHQEFQKKIARMKSLTLISKEYERILIEFSWKSSQIEGNTYSLISTETLIKENIPEAGKTKKETQMILNHKDAFRFALENRKEFQVFSLAKIEHMHSLLVHDLGVSRNIRTGMVGIAGSNYKPLDNQFQIEEAIQKMVKLINEKQNFIEKAFLSLTLLSYIQAFEDGNKRNARMTANAILLAYNSTPISYRAVNVDEYKKASLLFYEQNNLSYFKEIFIEQLAFAVKNYF